MSSDRFYSGLKSLDSLHGLSRRVPALTAPARWASYAAYRGLEVALGRRHPHGRVLGQARSLVGSGAESHLDDAPRVLFFTVRGWFVHVGTEAVLAKALERRGAEVSFFLCGGRLEQCDFKPGTDAHVTQPLCWRCTGFAGRLLAALELPSRRLGDLVASTRNREATELVASLSRQDLDDFVYRDHPLGDYVRASVQKSLLRGDIGEDAFSERVLRGFIASAILYLEAAEALLDEVRPDAVVMTNGLFVAERVMLEEAVRRGVRVVTYERGIPPGSVLLDHDQPAVRFDLDAFWPAAAARPLSSVENRELDDYLAERAGGRVGVIDIWPRMEEDRDRVRERLGLGGGRQVVVVFTNVLWDSAVFGRDVAFDGMFDWVAETIRLCAEMPEIDLVVRVHPSEVRIPMSESRDRAIDRIAAAFPSLPANVRVVRPEESTSSYALMDLAAASLVYTSTIGVEAAVRGRPVLVAGRPHFRGKGWTLDIESREGYRSNLETALASGPLAPEKVELARRYAYLFFFRFMQPFPWVVDVPRAERRLTFERLDDLDPGQDETLDRICRGILEGTPFVDVPAAESGP